MHLSFFYIQDTHDYFLAGGWIARAYLSDREYGGKIYNGKELVHSIITLGSPHGNAPGPAFKVRQLVISLVPYIDFLICISNPQSPPSLQTKGCRMG